MTSQASLPLGIRLNNPGNLRAAYGMSYPTVLEGGYARFKTMEDGVRALASLTWDYYQAHSLFTLPRFLARYAPASENDLLAYERNMTLLLGSNPLRIDTDLLGLNISWRALSFMRALVICEVGHPPSSWIGAPEWIDLTTWVTAMQRSNRWAHV